VEPFPEKVDWKEVVRLSYEHKVSALAVDGLEASGYDPYEGLDDQQTKELKAVLVPWIKDVENTEWSYCYYVEVLKTLCQIFIDNGLTPIILKGYGLSLNYPRPSHRGAGDIDLFLVDGDGRPAAEEGDRVVETVLGIKPKADPSSHHSHYEFKGISVENHYELSEWILGSKLVREFLKETKEMLCATKCNNTYGLNVPDATFNAIFLMWHLRKHFMHGEIKYRQLCDWALFVQKNHKEIDWQKVNTVWTKCKMSPFVDAISYTVGEVLGVDQKKFPKFTKQKPSLIDPKIGKLRSNGSGIKNVLFYLRNKEKMELATGEKWYSLTIQSIIDHICRRRAFSLYAKKWLEE